jgi:GntR family transcriptional regulator
VVGDEVTAHLRARLAETGADWPLYRRLMAALEAEILSGRLRPGAPLPGERILAEQLALSRVTVRKALDGLVAEGMLRRRHGARTEVNARVEKALSGLTSFSEDMRQRGLSPGFHWLSRELTRPNPTEMMALGVSSAAPVWRLERVRTADGRPLALEVSTVPMTYLDSADAVEASLYEALEARGALPVRALQRLRAARPTPKDRDALGCAEDTPILEIERRCFRADGQVVEYSRTRYRGDVYDFVVELTR